VSLSSASSLGTAEGNTSSDAAKSGKPKKRVSWRAGSLDDVAQASSSHAGLATAEEIAQGQQERFTWKVVFPLITLNQVHPCMCVYHLSNC